MAYVDKEPLHQALVEFLTKREAAVEAGDPIPGIPNYIGSKILDICETLSHHPSFSRYTYINDMIDHGVDLCLQYTHKYNFRKYNNPHTFYTMYAWRGFVNTIGDEKRHAYIKAKMAISPDELSAALQDVDKDLRPAMEDLSVPFFDIEEYERKHLSKPPKAVNHEPMGLELFLNSNEDLETSSDESDVTIDTAIEYIEESGDKA